MSTENVTEEEIGITGMFVGVIWTGLSLFVVHNPVAVTSGVVVIIGGLLVYEDGEGNL